MIIHYNKDNVFDDEIKTGKVIVDFFATWCGPCKMLSPILEEIGEENKDIKIIKIDVDAYEDLAMKFGIMSVPTLLFYKDGNLINKKIGFCDKEELLNIINEIGTNQ